MIEDLYTILKIESHTEEGKRICADRLKTILEYNGFSVKLHTVGSAPFIEAFIGCPIGNQILFYSHYDVKPPGNLKEWIHPPFSPYNDGKRIFARGAGDAKGQIYAVINGVKKYIKDMGKEQLGITLVLEGNEESKSPSLETYCAELATRKKFEFGVMIDSHWFYEKPIIAIGNRGQLKIQLEFQDEQMPCSLHAGNYGGIYQGAAILAVTKIQQLYQSEIMKAFLFSGDEKNVFRNACTLTDLNSGETHRSMIPRRCRAKLDFRFCNNEEMKRFFDGLAVICHENKISLQVLQYGEASSSIRDGKYRGFIQEAVKEATGKEPLMEEYLGAYLPMKKILTIGVPVYILPLAQYDEHNHAPNENILISHLEIGEEVIYRLLYKVRQAKIIEDH